EIKAFVDQGEVRNDVAGHRQGQRGPILKRWRLDVAARDFAVADSHPVKQLSPRRFDGRQSLGVPRRGHRCEHRSRRKILQRFQDQTRGYGGLVDSYARAGQYISILILRNVDVEVAIAAAGMIATNVHSDSAGARRWPDYRELTGNFGGQNSGRFKAVLNRRSVQDEACHACKIAGGGRYHLSELTRVRRGQVASHASRHGHAAPEARTKKAGGSLEQTLLDARGVGGRHAESDVAAQRPDVRNVG